MTRSTTLDDLRYIFEKTPTAAGEISLEKWKEAGIFITSHEGIEIDYSLCLCLEIKSIKEENISYEG